MVVCAKNGSMAPEFGCFHRNAEKEFGKSDEVGESTERTDDEELDVTALGEARDEEFAST